MDEVPKDQNPPVQMEDYPSFEEICAKIWEDFVKHMDMYFTQPGKVEKYFNYYQQECQEDDEGGKGAIVIFKEPWSEFAGESSSEANYCSLSALHNLVGNNYDTYVSAPKPNKAYVILAFLMSGESGVPENMTSPNMVVRSCLYILEKGKNDQWIHRRDPHEYFYETRDDWDDDEHEEEHDEDDKS